MPLLTSVQDDVDLVDDAALAQLLDAKRFPSCDDVDRAAKLFRPICAESRQASQTPNAGGRRYVRDEGRDYLVAIAAGVVAVRSIDHERREATAGLARKGLPAGRLDQGQLEVDGTGRPLPCIGGRLVVLEDGTGEWIGATPTRVVSEWSRKSRANMTRCLSELDYAPITDQVGTPAMVTTTYGRDWQTVAPSGRAVKRHLRTFFKRFRRAWGFDVPYLWKLEFQRRGAPHFHMFFIPPTGTALCSCCDQMLPFHDRRPGQGWLAHQWADVVGHDDHLVDQGGNTERDKHRKAGVGVDYKEGARCTDPKRLAVYFTKHGGAAGGKEYQHQVPFEWRTATNGPGRFWGHVGLKRIRSEAYVGQETFVQVRRTLRRLASSRRLTVQLHVDRGAVAHFINTDTGEFLPVARRRRKVTRRRKVPCASAAGGGFLLVNDGPELAKLLARL